MLYLVMVSDEIHYQMLNIFQISHLLVTLLNIFYNIRTTGKFPKSWLLVTITPIPKPSKNPAEPNNYIPIALKRHLLKILERMINKRFTLHLESNNHILRF